MSETNNQVIAFDYENFIGLLCDNIEKDLSITITEENSELTQAEMPFITYAFINPHLDVGYSQFASSYFDMVMTFTAHSTSAVEAMTKADLLRSWFKDQEVQYQFSLNGIGIMSITDSRNIDNVFSIGYDRRSQLTVRFSSISQEVHETPTIKDIEAPKANISKGE